jgi:hypothetical protein
MFELYAFLSLMSLGYVLSKNSTNLSASKMPLAFPIDERPSGRNVYHSDRIETINQLERKVRQETVAKAEATKRYATVKSRLADIDMPATEFTHNNMTPFFGGRVKQNMDAHANDVLLSTFTGAYDRHIHQKKKEIEPMFNRVGDIEDVYGSAVKADYHMDRLAVGRIRNNERPFQPLNVGPGINKGYEWRGSGGKHQDDLDILAPKTVDDLRVVSNPKVTYEGRVVSGAGIGRRGYSGKVFKNKPSLFEERSGERNFTTASGIEAQTLRPDVEVKPTERVTTSTEYFGVATRVDDKAPTIPSAQVKDTSRQQLEDFGMRNVDGEYRGAGDKFDFGKSAIDLPAQERDLTNQKTYEGNLVSLVKSITAPLMDIVRTNRKEYHVHHPRTFGELKPQGPSKITVKDPNDVARTTIKETNIHDTWDGVLTGPKKLIVYDPDDVLRTTTRNTLTDVSNDTNLKGATKGTSHTPGDKMRTTLKETVPEGSHFGMIGVAEDGGAYMTTTVDVPKTQKEFLANNEYFGGAGQSKNDAYTKANVKVDRTQKEYLSDNDYFGVAMGDAKPTSYEEFFNAEINVLKEGTLVGRNPTAEGAKVAVGAEEINVSSRKIESDYMSSGYNNIGKVWEPPAADNSTCNTRTKARIEEENVRFDTCVLSGLQSNPYAMKPLYEGGGSA